MKRKLILAGALTAAAVSLGASAQEWQLVALDPGQLTFADGTRVQRNEIAASVWVLESFPEVRHIGADQYPYRSRSLRYVLNCNEETYAIAEWIVHEGALGHGRAVWSARTEVPTFVHVSDGEPQAALLAAACDATALAQHKTAIPLAN